MCGHGTLGTAQVIFKEEGRYKQKTDCNGKMCKQDKIMLRTLRCQRCLRIGFQILNLDKLIYAVKSNQTRTVER